MTFDPNTPSPLGAMNPLLMVLLQAIQQQQQNQGSTPSNIPGISQMSNGVYMNQPAVNPDGSPLAPMQPTGEAGGQAAGMPTAQTGQWAGMTPDELSYNMQVNYARNQGGAAGMTDQEALLRAQEAVARQGSAAALRESIDQKYAYTDVLRSNAVDKRASEEESRNLREQEGEQGRISREKIAQWNLDFKNKNLRVQWSQKAKDAIEAFARTPTEDARTRVRRFPNAQEMDEYMMRLQQVPSALEDFPEEKFAPPPADNTKLSEGDNKTGGGKTTLSALPPQMVNTFAREVQTLGMAEAIKRFLASPSIPKELKEQLLQLTNGNQ